MTCLLKIAKRLLNWYVIWFFLYALIFNLLMALPIEYTDVIKEDFYPVVFLEMFIVVVVILILISNVAGLGLALLKLFHVLSDVKMWIYDDEQWFMKHSHGIGTEGFSFESFLEHDILVMAMAFIIFAHLLLSAKRCKEKGVSAWLALIPLYNPLGLFYKKKNHSLPNKETAS